MKKFFVTLFLFSLIFSTAIIKNSTKRIDDEIFVLKENIMDPIDASPTWRWFGYDNSMVIVDGINVQSVSGGGHFGGGIFINSEDHARFGLLFLRDGIWGGERLLSSEWIEKIRVKMNL